MKPQSFLAILMLSFAAMSSAFAASGAVVQVSENTYSIVKEAHTAFNRDTQNMKDAAMREAEKFCHDQGKQLKVVTWVVSKPLPMMGYASAKLVFKALAPGDPELTAAPASLAPVSAAVAAAPGDLYSELLKLDDLKTRGILTEKEFESEKKKALSRSR